MTSKALISELENRHKGQPIAVLGGGPSLPDDVGRLPAGCVMIMVNYHAVRILRPDYMVFMDSPSNIEISIDTYYNFKGPRISQLTNWSDYILDVPYWDGGISSSLATWLACYMGGNPVLLAGMDCYSQKKPYFYEDKRLLNHPCFDYPLENHLKAWQPAQDKCPNSHVIRAVSGPLIEMFGRYKCPLEGKVS